MRIWPWVALGSALGGTARFVTHELLHSLWPHPFPWTTLLINVLGSFVIGYIASLSEPGGRVMLPTHVRQFLMTGVCGGYTTFSILSLETLVLLEHAPVLGLLNLVATATVCLLAVWAGFALAARHNRLVRS